MTLAHKRDLWLTPVAYAAQLPSGDRVALNIHAFYHCLAVRNIHPALNRKTTTVGYADAVALRDAVFVTRRDTRKNPKVYRQHAEIHGILTDREELGNHAGLTEILFNLWQSPHFQIPGDDRPLRGAERILMTRRSLKILNPVFA